jgi:serine/threonine protein kinase
MSAGGLASPAIERLVAGKYRVERVLGHGGSGLVVAATHVHLDQRVAIKTMLRTALQHRNALERFAREARAAARIQSDHVACIYDVGEDDEGLPYIVMEYLEGSDLWEALEERGALPVEEAVGYAIEVCEALSQAHSVGVVHRDLKPANVFLARRADGSVRVKVLDFGMSKLESRLPERPLTDPRLIMGTPGWMSPEQLRSTRDVDARSDVWSVGAVLYNMLAGRPPNPADTVARLSSTLSSQPDPPSRHRTGIPAGLDAVVLKCLRNERSERFQTVAELASALAEFGPAYARELAPRIGGTRPSVLPPTKTGSSNCHYVVGGVTRTPSERFARRTTTAQPRRGVPFVAAAAVAAILGLMRSRTPPMSIGAPHEMGIANGASRVEVALDAPGVPPVASGFTDAAAPMPDPRPFAAKTSSPSNTNAPDDVARATRLQTVRASAWGASSDVAPVPTQPSLLHPEFGDRK